MLFVACIFAYMRESVVYDVVYGSWRLRALDVVSTANGGKGCSGYQLRMLLGVTRQSLSEYVRPLVKAGLINRRFKRFNVYMYSVTPDGLAYLDANRDRIGKKRNLKRDAKPRSGPIQNEAKDIGL